MATEPGPLSPLREARTYVETHLTEGVTCPACGQYAKRYRRSIHAGMARSAIALYQQGAYDGATVGTIHTAGWTHLTRAGNPGGDEAKLRYWRLLEEMVSAGPPARSTGFWRLTRRGVFFVRDALLVPKFALVYNGECLGHELPLVGIRDCLGSKLNYEELMAR